MPGQRVSRSELYDLVWSEPASKLAKRFGISDVMLAKVCRGSNIPKPSLRYWAKQDAGKPTKKLALPARALGQSDHVVFGSEPTFGTGARRRILLEGPIPDKPVFPESLAEVKARAHALADAAPIRKTLSGRHPEVSKLLAKDEANKKKRTGRLLDQYLYPVIAFSKQGRRRFTILNSILIALTQCGASAAKVRGDGYQCAVAIGDQRIDFELRYEGAAEVRRSVKEAEETSPLELVISRAEAPDEIASKWNDREKQPLESQVKQIVAGFLIMAEWRYRESELQRYEQYFKEKAELEATIKRHREERIQEELDRWEKAEEIRREELFEEVSAWVKAGEIRAYVQAAIVSRGKGELTDRWTEWALAKADQIDPLKNGDSEYER